MKFMSCCVAKTHQPDWQSIGCLAPVRSHCRRVKYTQYWSVSLQHVTATELRRHC